MAGAGGSKRSIKSQDGCSSKLHCVRRIDIFDVIMFVRFLMEWEIRMSEYISVAIASKDGGNIPRLHCPEGNTRSRL